MKKNILAIAMVMLLGVSLMACGSKSDNVNTGSGESSTEASADAKKIGVLQYVQHPALDKANEGFVAALKEAGMNVDIEQENAGGEQSAAQTIANKLVNDKKDLILAIATPAAQAVAGATSDIPVVITAVTDPAESGLVDSNE